ncbi:MAG: acyl-CoA dehydrogenase family protein [Intrasporangium sp.]|uniref:acyl-CoA dehydrogenase family protein n=1 Tax=Intrasporangium sp. TaxID=1925024 RepID=UPI0026476BAF|nr:acyl-CoA dehydrogenase family protein [Intrasporangium sp.]MDN5794425.1 acyl-CoA dehydrogenase family protein [Intrasporangium sp.]
MPERTEAAERRSAARATALRDGLDAGLAAAGATRETAGELPPALLLAVRLGASEWLLSVTTAHARSRRVGDGPLLANPLVRGQLAEILVEQRMVEAHLEGIDAAAEPPTWVRLHRRITDADRALLRLLGARGYLEDGPGGLAMASEAIGFAGAPPAGARA